VVLTINKQEFTLLQAFSVWLKNREPGESLKGDLIEEALACL
jgi:hypothetical protein